MSSSVGRNSLIMASGTAASRVTGQIRTILLAWALGTTGYAANAYQAGSMIPQVIYTLVSGGIFNAVLVPPTAAPKPWPSPPPSPCGACPRSSSTACIR